VGDGISLIELLRTTGLVKRQWFKTYAPGDLPEKFDQIVQSWDTANKATELANYSVCTTWGRQGRQIYLLNLFSQAA